MIGGQLFQAQRFGLRVRPLQTAGEVATASRLLGSQGVKAARLQPQEIMNDNPNCHHSSAGALGALVAQLIVCGGVLSQIVNHMVQWEPADGSAGDAVPIPAALQELLRGVLEPLASTHSTSELEAITVILAEVTETICDEVFFVPSLDEPSRTPPGPSSRNRSCNRRRR